MNWEKNKAFLPSTYEKIGAPGMAAPIFLGKTSIKQII